MKLLVKRSPLAKSTGRVSFFFFLKFQLLLRSTYLTKFYNLNMIIFSLARQSCDSMSDFDEVGKMQPAAGASKHAVEVEGLVGNEKKSV